MSNHQTAGLLLTAWLSVALAMHNLKYSDLEAMNADCSPRDTCATNVARKFANTNCECDEKCHLYDDCCIDAKVNGMNVTPLTNETCIEDSSGNHRGAYVVNKCRTGWVGSSMLRQKCEVGSDLSDPLVSAPVTDLQTLISYKSRYCSECNDVDPANLLSWAISVGCEFPKTMNTTGNITSKYIRDNMAYKTSYPNRNKWGIYYWNKDAGRDTFYPCEFTYSVPARINTTVRFCRPKITATCATNWRTNSIRVNCLAYTAVVYAKSKTYRNPHCALCNNVDLKDIGCTPDIISRSKRPMSFTLLLDVSSRDGEKVGEVNNCKKDEVNDSFYGRCRKLTCALPGYKLVGKKCVKQ